MEGVVYTWNSVAIRIGIASFKLCGLAFGYYSSLDEGKIGRLHAYVKCLISQTFDLLCSSIFVSFL